MSILECILYPILGVATIAYVIKCIYDFKHPEKVKAKKEAKKAKKIAKKEAKKNGTIPTSQEEDQYE